jgi:hypothetical protein
LRSPQPWCNSATAGQYCTVRGGGGSTPTAMERRSETRHAGRERRSESSRPHPRGREQETTLLERALDRPREHRIQVIEVRPRHRGCPRSSLSPGLFRVVSLAHAPTRTNTQTGTPGSRRHQHQHSQGNTTGERKETHHMRHWNSTAITGTLPARPCPKRPAERYHGGGHRRQASAPLRVPMHGLAAQTEHEAGSQAGVVHRTRPAEVGQRVPAELTAAGRTVLAMANRNGPTHHGTVDFDSSRRTGDTWRGWDSEIAVLNTSLYVAHAEVGNASSITAVPQPGDHIELAVALQRAHGSAPPACSQPQGVGES